MSNAHPELNKKKEEIITIQTQRKKKPHPVFRQGSVLVCLSVPCSVEVRPSAAISLIVVGNSVAATLPHHTKINIVS
jgi:hypothetical protein